MIVQLSLYIGRLIFLVYLLIPYLFLHSGLKSKRSDVSLFLQGTFFHVQRVDRLYSTGLLRIKETRSQKNWYFNQGLGSIEI